MSAVGVADFVTTLELHFPRQKFGGDETMDDAWMATMVRGLGKYDDAILAEAAERIIATRHPKKDGRFFPAIAECTEICNQVASERASRSLALLPKPVGDSWSAERLELAFDLVRGDLGKQAAREGWVASLYHFARQHMRLPQPDEIVKIKVEAKEVDRLIASFGEATGGLPKALRDLGDSVLKRREELCDGVLNGVVEKKSWFLRG